MPTSKLPTRVVSMADNTNLGDVAIETSFADYQDVGGLKLPARLTTKTDKYTTAELRVTKQAVDGEAGDLAAPPAAASAAAMSAPPPATVAVEEVAKGIWSLAGQSHHSVLVEFDDHLMLIEAPQNDTRTLAVIAKAKELRPGKPLTRRRQQPPPLRSFRRHPGRGGGGTDGRRAESQRAVLHGCHAAVAHDRARRARRRNPGR